MSETNKTTNKNIKIGDADANQVKTLNFLSKGCWPALWLGLLYIRVKLKSLVNKSGSVRRL